MTAEARGMLGLAWLGRNRQEAYDDLQISFNQIPAKHPPFYDKSPSNSVPYMYLQYCCAWLTLAQQSQDRLEGTSCRAGQTKCRVLTNDLLQLFPWQWPEDVQ